MKKLFLGIILILALAVPAVLFADSDDYAIPVDSLISTSKAQDADLVGDFGPSGSDRVKQRAAKFLIRVTPATADAIVQMQCTLWNEPTSALVATTENLKSGAALTAGAAFDYDYVMSYKDGLCNIQATSGGTQNWTVVILKSTSAR